MQSNKLISGLLQLTEGTHLIADETQLSGGNFSEQGVVACCSVVCLFVAHLRATGQLNLRALRRALAEQRVQYDFAFHHLEFNVNLPVVLLSRSKALLPADCLVPLRPADSAPTAVVPTDGLQDIRLYLQSARNAEFTIDPEVTQVRVRNNPSLARTELNNRPWKSNSSRHVSKNPRPARNCYTTGSHLEGMRMLCIPERDINIGCA